MKKVGTDGAANTDIVIRVGRYWASLEFTNFGVSGSRK